ncbi:MAG: hypothetical protein QOJ40_2750 [Verrucomicrobiota bacterium]
MEKVRSPGFSRFGVTKGSASAIFETPRLAPARPAKAGTPCAWLLLLLVALCGCSTSRPTDRPATRHFDFQTDTFAYPNELVWEYYFDAKGKWRYYAREPRSTYSHHCFVVARSARQFFINARFDPKQPIADEAAYRSLIRRVVTSSPRHSLPEAQKIVIPGYANLREFSQAQQKLLRAECGGSWQSYVQRGHWRIMVPFTRHQQQHVSELLLAHLKENPPLVVHVIRFPQLYINHALVIFDALQTADKIEFLTYDPNDPAAPTAITYDRATRTFTLPTNKYFFGGRVDVYEVYRGWFY